MQKAKALTKAEEIAWIHDYLLSQKEWQTLETKLQMFIKDQAAEWRINKNYLTKIRASLLNKTPTALLGIPAEDLIIWQNQLLKEFDQKPWKLSDLLKVKKAANIKRNETFENIKSNYKREIASLVKSVKRKLPQDILEKNPDSLNKGFATLKDQAAWRMLEKTKNYDPTQGRFMSYAQKFIEKELTQLAYDEKDSELSHHDREWKRRLRKYAELSDQEVALLYLLEHKKQISIEQVSAYRRQLNSHQKILSIDSTPADSDVSLSHSIEDSNANIANAYEEAEAEAELFDLVRDQLTQAEYQLFLDYFNQSGEPLPNEQIQPIIEKLKSYLSDLED
jgi:hypothetical protein